MSINYRLLKKIFGVLLLLYALLITYCYARDTLYFALLNSQIRTLADVEEELLNNLNKTKNTDFTKAEDCINYIREYYPAGTKFEASPVHEYIMEKMREEMLYHVENELKQYYNTKSDALQDFDQTVDN